MDESSKSVEQEILDVSPYLKLVIDKDARWFQNGIEIVHPEIYKYFNELLEKTSEGRYQIRLGREVCRVEVEDAPFVVQSISEGERGGGCIGLNDGSTECLNPEWFWIGKDNIPYCLVKAGLFHARFSRPAYYALAGYIVPDDDEQSFFLNLDGHRTPVMNEKPDVSEAGLCPVESRSGSSPNKKHNDS